VGEGDRVAVERACLAARTHGPPPVLRTTSPTLRAREENKKRAGEENEGAVSGARCTRWAANP
jgi:hypothetical protein